MRELRGLEPYAPPPKYESTSFPEQHLLDQGPAGIYHHHLEPEVYLKEGLQWQTQMQQHLPPWTEQDRFREDENENENGNEDEDVVMGEVEGS
ncbi:hypothetical protein GYMLUDRAFT_44847 [Collybiopsis luxurians FD-317 M1]|uniref:Uncharacterized protein n=1 Tax=Collybiopsis luxurians FD-317 M1 TaxID=944289 RepID=A0A0D0BUG0_9AGAR|nr:hypothetical protein GYMLUDRAFT_44847 [Collybiopsis luxurians FD-317 M1]